VVSDEGTKGAVMPKCRVVSKMKKAGNSEAVGIVELAFMKDYRFRNCVLPRLAGR
jgi:hypothetical protein